MKVTDVIEHVRRFTRAQVKVDLDYITLPKMTFLPQLRLQYKNEQ